MTLKLEDIRYDGLLSQPVGGDELSHFAELHRDRGILITGAGGSIGSALSRTVYQLQPRALVLLDSSEQNLYYIYRELSAISAGSGTAPILGSVADPRCVRDVFQRSPTYQPSPYLREQIATAAQP
jgi:FlaA1/EpsC-like NDP-sugar epimerase